MNATHVWFGPEDRPLSGWLHAPADGRARAGVVMCPPLNEREDTYATLKSLAEDLTARQFAALRFDYDGTGSSAGDERDPSRLAAWLGSVRAAVSFMRARGVSPVALVGMRFGALLAAVAAEDDPDIGGLVLWDPVTSGRAYLLEMQMLGERGFNSSASRPDGGLETPGMVIAAATAADIGALTLRAPAGPSPARVLVLGRAERALGHLKALASAPHVDWAEAIGQEDLIERGYLGGIVAHATNKSILDWLCTAMPSQLSTLTLCDTGRRAIVGRTAAGDPVTETAMSIGSAGLFGFLTEAPGCISPTTVVFLGGTSQDRLWVEWARRLSGHGLRCFRLDLSGWGDSPVRHPGQRGAVLRAPEHFDDVAEACAELCPSDPSDVVLVGHCAAGYQALDSAMSLKPRGVIALNPNPYFRFPEWQAGRKADPRRRIARPRKVMSYDDRFRAYYQCQGQPGPNVELPAASYRSFARRLHSKTGPRLRFARWLRGLVRRGRYSMATQFQLMVKPDRRPSKWLKELVTHDVDVVIVCGKADKRVVLPGLREKLAHQLAATGNFMLRYIPNLEHANITSDRRSALGDLITDHVSSRFAPAVVSLAGPPPHD
ncbi:MAG TPA: alpha/beta hydrolase family protein, partial [Acidimicrobiales bacterium]|nr:alpha/beta hydrolase family protein [Acidimicrobiales bacterium]